MTRQAKSFLRVIGFAAGWLCAAGFIVSGGVPMPPGQLGALELNVAAGRAGELVVSPARRPIVAGKLRPGTPDQGRRGTMSIWNPTDVTLSVRLRARPSTRDLGRLVVIRVENGTKRLFEGTLGDLSAGTPPLLDLTAGERESLTIHAWLPESDGSRLTAGSLDVALDFDTTVLGG